MTDSPASPYPTYHPNFVTISYLDDNVVLELRSVIVPHRDLAAAPTVALTQAQIYEIDPIARVVMPYRSAKLLKEWLTENWSTIAKNRTAI